MVGFAYLEKHTYLVYSITRIDLFSICFCSLDCSRISFFGRFVLMILQDLIAKQLSDYTLGVRTVHKICFIQLNNLWQMVLQRG